MIDLYYWTTPNGHKITMFLEEVGLEYRIVPINIGKGEQFESGAILLYLAEKTGKLIPQSLRGRATCLEWLFWQMAGLGPMAGQNHHFTQYAPEPIAYAIDRYVRETARLYAVLDQRLKDHAYLADEYSIADIACYPWIVPYERQRQKLEDFPNVKRWFEAIKARPATVKAYAKAKEVNPQPPPAMSEEAKKILFGQSAATVKA
jgi:GST-like protein